MNFEELNKHMGHKTSEDKVTLDGENIIISKYCYDCNKEYVIETKENKWNLDHDITCPSCGQKAITSTKYFQYGNRVRKKRYTHCFSCDYTREDFVDED